ncbi:MAG: NAD(P)/FAD-dependent oxidoreductase [Chlamydiales bacterium]|nr:NAD(P)/FAD-dependent oxidoreductase [Chlamydiales bacterium]
MAYSKVVIVGGGFAGLNTAKALKKANFDVLIIDKTNHHLFQPLLYQVATAALSPGDIATPIREILSKQENATVIMGEVVSIDKTLKQLTLANGDIIGYDYLVIAPGARHSYFGNDQWEKNAPGLKTISDALKIREQVLVSFEKAERMDSIAEAAKFLNFVVIGGGPTGVEMAGAIAEIAHHTLFKNFRRIKPEKSRIFLIEAAPHILPTYPEKLSIRAKHDLEELGVTVLVSTKVTDVTIEGVQTEGLFIEARNVIWAAGNQASPLLKSLDVPLDRPGRVIVGPDLSIPGHPDVFVLGDAAHTPGKDGKPLPGVATVAIQQARYVAKNILHAIPQEQRKPFVYFDKGSMATIGRSKAVVAIGSIRFSGLLAWLAWCFVHIVYLIGFRNRLSVMTEWFYHFFTGERGVRLIYRTLDPELKKKNH